VNGESTTNVTKFYPKDAAKDADNVLEQAIGVYDEVIIIGYRKDDGTMDARATLGLRDGGDMLWLLETFKMKLVRGDYLPDEVQSD